MITLNQFFSSTCEPLTQSLVYFSPPHDVTEALPETTFVSFTSGGMSQWRDTPPLHAHALEFRFNTSYILQEKRELITVPFPFHSMGLKG
ncbi:hypothetical protein CDAR_66181 [Caerostris darwini]|uniref:Cytochrome c biogenesis B n=1 Tax=Caerostris darwini TaxID=1538125 RepID=A0AAV4VUD9_9ARAC|nr:hypothetical protein CDAR_66181 [Caerostris darwini]